VRVSMMAWIRNQLLSRENRVAVLLCLAVILVIILTADQSPQWIYQGF
jgi:hypothetical protein